MFCVYAGVRESWVLRMSGSVIYRPDYMSTPVANSGKDGAKILTKDTQVTEIHETTILAKTAKVDAINEAKILTKDAIIVR